MSSSAPSAENLLKGASIARSRPKLNPWPLYIAVLLVNDRLGMALAFRLAYWVRFEFNLPIFQLDGAASPPFYSALMVALVPLWLLVFALSGVYQRKNLLGGTLEYSLIFRATTIGLLLVILAGFFEPEITIARGWLLTAWALTFFLTSAGRFWLRRVVYLLRGKGYFLSRALLVGANAEGALLAEQFEQWKTSGLDLVGLVDGGRSGTHGGLPILGAFETLDRIVDEHGITELILATSALTRLQMLEVFERFGVSETVNLRLSSGLFEVITTGLEIKEIGFVPLVTVNKVRLKGADRALKLALDYAFAIPGLILISPFILLIAIAVKLESPGPVLFRRRVMGVNGKQFDAYKFRTMVTNGDELLAARPELQVELAENHKLKSDPRITRLGELLRRYSLDELPQLFNVLKREMSLVGPRMISPPEMAKYDKWGINLLTVHPGITGIWQVSGRSDVSYEERIRMDMHYVRNWSLWLDLQLLLQTLPAVLKGRGAY